MIAGVPGFLHAVFLSYLGHFSRKDISILVEIFPLGVCSKIKSIYLVHFLVEIFLMGFVFREGDA